MTLGIVMQSVEGLALGADSIVSSTQVMIPLNKLAPLLGAMMKHPDEIDIAETIKKMSSERTCQTYRSAKIKPMFKKNGVHFGARIKAGNDILARLQDKVIENVDEELQDVGRDISFEDYIRILYKRMEEIGVSKFNAEAESTFIHAAYCSVHKRYEVLRANVNNRMNDSKLTLHVSIDDHGNKFVTYAGEAELVETLLFGSSGKTDATFLDALRKFVVTVISAIQQNENCSETKIEHAREHVRSAGNFFMKSIEMGIEMDGVNVLLSEYDSYDQEANTIAISDYLHATEKLVVHVINQSIYGKRNLEHLKIMTLRELLKVIEYLITATARSHEYLLNDIPSVGGDLYFATITKEEGFKFRNIRDIF